MKRCVVGSILADIVCKIFYFYFLIFLLNNIFERNFFFLRKFFIFYFYFANISVSVKFFDKIIRNQMVLKGANNIENGED